MSKERLTEEEILIRYIVIYPPHDNEPYYIKSDVIKAMQSFAAQEVAAIEMPTEEEIAAYLDKQDFGYGSQYIFMRAGARIGIDWFRSRMEEKK
jgi:hypothetical protein